MSPVAYRSDIDGLRAIAVLAVVLYHFGVTALSGGFVGVDVFFVISGYLITSILQRQFAQGRFSISDFYRRRALRILPALFFLIAILVLLAPILLSPLDIRALGRSIPFVAAFLSNFYFGREFFYFDPASDTQMLLHTWSLAVEEQFYIVYPLLLGLVLRFAPRSAAFLVWLSIVLSLALSIYLLETDQSKIAFYMSPPRAWELGIGAVVALGGFPVVTHRGVREALSLFGLALIFYSVAALDAASSFPGLNALPPCLGTALVIAYGAGTRFGAVLGSALPRSLGKISYSLYLWHWPVAVIARQFLGEDLGLGGLAGCAIVCLALSIASYRWVETPFRTGFWSRLSTHRLLAGALACLVAVAATGPALSRLSDASLLLQKPEARQDLAYLDYDQRPESRAEVSRDVCFLTDVSPRDRLNPAVCLSDKPDRPNVLAFGDSYLAYLLPGLRAAFPTVNFVQATAAGCTPLETYALGRPYCRPMIDMIYERLATHRYQAVILGGRWVEQDIPQLIESIARLRQDGQTVIVIGPSLEYSDALPAVLARRSWIGDGFSVDRFQRAQSRVLESAMRDAVVDAGAVYLSQQRALCVADRCETRTPSGAPIAFDHAHLTSEGARHVAARISEQHPELSSLLSDPRDKHHLR